MGENKNQKTRGVTIKSPADVRRIARRVISDIFTDGSQIEHAGKINGLLTTWLKGWEVQRVDDDIKELQAAVKELQDELKKRG